MRVGYVRISTAKQHEDRQLMMMEEQKIERVFTDKTSGKDTNRPAFKEMMNFVRDGDTVVVESISRIARNIRDLLSIVSQLSEKGAEFVSLKENIDTSTPQGRFMLTVFGALAELERENILQRQREGIAAAVAKGTRFGRPRVKKPPEFDSVLSEVNAGKITATEAMRRLNLKRNTFYNFLKEAKEAEAPKQPETQDV